MAVRTVRTYTAPENQNFRREHDPIVANARRRSSGVAAEMEPPKEAPAVATAADEKKLQFWETIRTLSDEAWGSHIVYLYRTQPAISLPGKSYYIEKRSTAFDEDEVLQTHGSGSYLAILKNNKEGELLRASINVYNEDMPPKVNPVHLAATVDPTWRKWIEDARPKEISDPASSAGREKTAQAQDSGNAASTAAVQQLADITKMMLERKEQPSEAPAPAGRGGMDEALVKLFTETARNRDEMAAKLAGNSGSATAAADPLIMLDRILSITEKLNRPQPTVTADPFAQMDRFMDLLNKAKSFSSEGPAPEPSMWERLFDKIGPTIAPALSAFVTAKMTQGRPNPYPSAPASPGVADSRTRLQALPQQQRAAETSGDQPVMESTSGAAAPVNPQTIQELHSLFQRIAPALVNALQTGRSGYDFGDWLADGEGLRSISLVKQVGAKSLIELVDHSYPDAAGFLLPMRAQFERFVQELCDWEPAPDDDQEAESDQQESQTAGKAAQ